MSVAEEEEEERGGGGGGGGGISSHGDASHRFQWKGNLLRTLPFPSFHSHPLCSLIYLILPTLSIFFLSL